MKYFLAVLLLAGVCWGAEFTWEFERVDSLNVGDTTCVHTWVFGGVCHPNVLVLDWEVAVPMRWQICAKCLRHELHLGREVAPPVKPPTAYDVLRVRLRRGGE